MPPPPVLCTWPADGTDPVHWVAGRPPACPGTATEWTVVCGRRRAVCRPHLDSAVGWGYADAGRLDPGDLPAVTLKAVGYLPATRIEPMPGRRPQIATREPLWPPQLIRAAQRPKVPMPPLHAPGDEPRGIVAPIVAGLVLAIPVALAAGGELWDIVQGWRCRRDVARACRSMR